MKIALVVCLLFPGGLCAQRLKPETAQAYDCYVQAAEGRMGARKALPVAEGEKVRTIEANGPNPHKLPGGQLYDWIGAIFISGTTLDRLIPMLQDYDHRSQNFPETISDSKLLCLSGKRSLSILHADEGTRRSGCDQRRGVGANGRTTLALPVGLHACRGGG